MKHSYLHVRNLRVQKPYKDVLGSTSVTDDFTNSYSIHIKTQPIPDIKSLQKHHIFKRIHTLYFLKLLSI